MWRDPLDELIADLERIVPAKTRTSGFDPVALCMEADRLERGFARERAQQHPRADVPASTTATVPAVWPAPPTRRLDPSAPWDYTGDTDPDDSSG